MRGGRFLAGGTGWAAGLLALGRHHDDLPDPAFLEWLQIQLTHLIGWGPWTVVALIGAVVLALPLGLVGFYLYHERRGKEKRDGR